MENLSCLAAYDSGSSATKLFYYNQTTRLAEEKADISAILLSEGIANPAIANIGVSHECMFFSIGDIVYSSNTTNYNNVTVPDGWSGVAFDPTYKIAVFGVNIYEYDIQNNRYNSALNPAKPVLQNKYVNLNNDKLIIFSYQNDNSVSPPVTQYRVHCLYYSETSWKFTNLEIIEGIQLDDVPEMKISPNY
jgi:hypothetical protein